MGLTFLAIAVLRGAVFAACCVDSMLSRERADFQRAIAFITVLAVAAIGALFGWGLAI